MLKFSFKTLSGLCFFAALFSTVISAQTPLVIAPEKNLERELGGRQTDSFSVALKGGEILRVSVMQKGVDVVLSLYSPDEKLLARRDAPNSTEGAEELSVIAPASGTFRIEVGSFDEKAVLGKYTIQIEKPRHPNEKDLQRVKAEQIFSDALLLRPNEDKESKLAAEAKLLETVPLWNSIGAKYWQALALLNAGYIEENFAEKKEDGAQAFQNFNTAANIFHELSETKFEQNSLAAIGDLHYKFEEDEKAIEAYNKASALAESASDSASDGVLQFDIGLSYYNLKKYEQSIAALKKSLEINRKLNNPAAVSTLLNRIGLDYSSLEKREEATGYYLQAADFARQIQDKKSEAQNFYNAGFDYSVLKNYPQAIEKFQVALTLRKSLDDKSQIAETYNQIIAVYKAQKDDAKTSATYDELLAFYRAAKDRAGEAATLNETGIFQANLKNFQKALELQSAALAVYRELNNQPMTATVLRNLAINYNHLNDKEKSADFYRQAADVFKQSGDQKETAATLESLAEIYYDSKKLNEAVGALQEAAIVYAQLKDEKQMARMLNRIGVYYDDFHEYVKADEYFQQALPVFRRLKDREFEARVLRNIGADYSDSNRPPEAIEFLQNALTIFRELGTFKTDEAEILTALGSTYIDIDENEKAIAAYTAALNLFNELNEPEKKAQAHNGIAVAFENTGDLQKSLVEYRFALPLFRQVGNRQGEMVCLINIGKMLQSLGSRDKAIETYKNAYAIAVNLNDKDHQFQTLDYLGNLTEGEESMEYYIKAKDIAVAANNKDQLAGIASSIGIDLSTSDNPETLKTALELFEQSLRISQNIGNNSVQLTALQGIAKIYYKQGDYQKSFEYLQQALPITRAGGDIRSEVSLMGNFMYLLKNQGNERLAILYGKQSINLSQKIRANIKGLDKEIQQSFLKSNEDKYRLLADLLIRAGRIPEAQAVLGMLKEEEYSEFVQRDEGEAKKLLGSVELSSDESAAVARYEKISSEITTKAAEYEKLKRQRPANDEEKAALDKKKADLNADLTAASQTFNLILKQIETEFAKTKPATDITAAMNENRGLQADLARWKIPNTVILSTIVGEENYSVILTTPSIQVVEQTPIKSAELNKMVHDFREAVQNPCACIDPRPLGQKLYDVLLKPIAPQLAELEKHAGEKPLTLVWSLDGTLRYLPISALWDGKNYLAEKYLNVEFSLASRTRLGENPSAEWHGLGLGVTQAHGDFVALPSVKDELLNGAIHDEKTPDSKGIVPGRVFLDTQFTESTFAQELSSGDYPLVHIASHFAFKPGNEKQSYLLLGDGGELSLDKIRQSPDFKFNGVELLTLSACNTATGEAGADGKEFESFAVLAQQNGAMAVLATLWSVNDESTQNLMSEFYRGHQENHLSKAEALRGAQLALLNGTLKAGQTQTRRSDLAGETNSNAANLPPFAKDASKPFAHPYYWSPFVLIGNWR